MTALLPSAALLTVAWLKTNTDLVAIHGGRVGTRLNATLPAIRVQRIGGIPVEPWRDEPVLQLECWADNEAAADLLARTVVAVLPTIRTAGAHTYSIESGPFWAADDPTLSLNVRYILSVRLLTTV